MPSCFGLANSGVARELLKKFSHWSELDGRIVGSNFLWENAIIAGVGPVTVDPGGQNAAIGRRLMEAVLQRAQKRGFVGVRLVQSAYHSRSLSLYTKLGFDAQEPLSALQGSPMGVKIPGYLVRSAGENDLEACNRLCVSIQGHDRRAELLDAITQRTATLVEHNRRVTGYATMVGFFGHAVGENNEDLKALIGGPPFSPVRGFCCRRATVSCCAGV